MDRIVYTAKEALVKSDQRLLILTQERINKALLRATYEGKYCCTIRNPSSIHKKELEEFIIRGNDDTHMYHFEWVAGPHGYYSALKIWWD